MRNSRALPTLLSLLLAVACGSGGADDGVDAPPTPTGPVATVQDEWTEDAFWAAVANDADLAALRDKVAADGFTTFVTAGALAEDGGARLEFAAWADAGGDPRAVVRHCKDTDCVKAIARVDGGTVAWADATGLALTVRTIAVPPLLRELAVSGGTTSVVAAVTAAAPIDPSTIDLSRRRLVVANQFGADAGLSGLDALGDLSTAQLFSEIVLHDRTGWADIEPVLQGGYPHEALVLVSQPVRQMFKQSVAKGQPNWYKTLGYEMSAGVYGFQRVTADVVAAALKAAPLSGPGLVFLLGGESLGDGTDGMTKAPQAAAVQLQFEGKVIAGFIGDATPAILVEATRDFLSQLAAGKAAGEARDHANAVLTAWGSAAQIGFTYGSDEAYKLLPLGDFWHGKAPASADMAPFFHFRKYCAAKAGLPEKAIEEAQANPAIRDMTINGPAFEGSMELEIGPTETLHATVRGVLGELREGAHFYFAYVGDAKDGYQGLTLYANARIMTVKTDAGTTTIEFAGTAEALPFTTSDGQACTLHDTFLEPMVGGQGYSKLILK